MMKSHAIESEPGQPFGDIRCECGLGEGGPEGEVHTEQTESLIAGLDVSVSADGDGTEAAGWVIGRGGQRLGGWGLSVPG